MTPAAKPSLTLDDLHARWAAADQAPAEEIEAANQRAHELIDSLREDGDRSKHAA